MIVANNVAKEGIGFGSDNNEVTIIETSGRTKHIPISCKDTVANIFLDSIKRLIKKSEKTVEDWY
jgi:phosphopantothenoylcysteine decarboxylase/phosphopantothenate--cysteine ligase